MTTIVEPMNDAIPASLVDESAPPEEVNDKIGFSFIQGNDKIDEVENMRVMKRGSGMTVMKQMKLKKICTCMMMTTMMMTMTMTMMMIMQMIECI